MFKPHASSVRQQAQAMANGAGAKPDFVYEHALKGFAVTPGEVEQLIKSRATPNKVSSAGTGSPNLLLYTGTDSAMATRTVFIGSLVGSKSIGKANWTAKADITVRDSSGNVVSGAAVAGRFNVSNGTYSCTTGSTGNCSMSVTLKNGVSSTVFTVSGITGTGMSYDATKNAAFLVTITK